MHTDSMLFAPVLEKIKEQIHFFMPYLSEIFLLSGSKSYFLMIYGTSTIQAPGPKIALTTSKFQ